MKKVLLFLLSLMLFTKLFGNPIPEPPVISELYIINENSWSLELMFPGESGLIGTNLNELQISTSAGTSVINMDYIIQEDEIIVINQDSLMDPISINRSGDYVQISEISEEYYVNDEIRFGNTNNAQISAPYEGQSIVNYRYSCFNYDSFQPGIEYHLVKSNNPSIGESAFYTESAKGTFSGSVFDNTGNPVEGIHISYGAYGLPNDGCGAFFDPMMTSENGSFSGQQFSGKHFLKLHSDGINTIFDTLVDIEPDSNNYCVFHLDTNLSEIKGNKKIETDYSLSCYPNPSEGQTYFKITAPEHKRSSLILKIYNQKAEIIEIIPVTGFSGNKALIKWNSNSQGVYYCKLEQGAYNRASCKLCIR